MTDLPHPQALIADKIPAWMVSATAQTHQHIRTALGAPPDWFAKACQMQPAVARGLAEAYADYRSAVQEVDALFKTLPDLQQFAMQLLTSALKERFGLGLDVSRTYLFNAGKAEAYQASMGNDPIISTHRAFKLATQSLLHCALQNFEATEAQPGGLDGQTLQSVVLDNNKFLGLQPIGNTLELAPQDFASLVRELDIGGQYQALVAATLNPAAGTNTKLASAEQHALCLELHRAYLKGMLDMPLYEALLKLARDGEAEYLERPLRCAFLKLFDVSFTGALVIGVVPSPERLLSYDVTLLPYKNVLITYLPGAAAPLKVHATVPEVQAHLREQLGSMEVRYLLQAVPARDRASFIDRLRDCLQPIDWNTFVPSPGHQGGQAERIRDPDAWVPVTLQPFNRPLLDQLVSQKRQRHLDDTAFHAVSTAQEDQKSSEKRMAYFAQLTMGALSIGAFVVPGLGQLMLGLSAIQLSYEVFEGIESWADGDREQALGYLMDIVENVAFTAALAATGTAAGIPAAERIPVETPSFIEELEPVVLPDGTRRLWHPDLQPFAHDIVLPAGLTPDEFGVYHHDGKTWLALDGNNYSVKQAADSGAYRVVHPSKALSYEPPLRHNGAGAWLHPADKPLQWQGLRLFRRLGHLNAPFSDETATQILRATGIDESVLRRVLSHNERLPALLEDTMQRFRLDLEVARDLPGAELPVRRAEFLRRYRMLAVTPSQGAAVLQRVYPQLPTAVTDELLRNSTTENLQTLIEGKVPLRVGEEIRQYQEQIRLTRAYEGLYLESVSNADTDLMIFHTLPQLADWPSEMRFEFFEGKGKASLLASIGPAKASRRRIITRYPGGYTASAPFPSSAVLPVHESIYGALQEALGIAEINNAAALRERVRQAPPIARGQLRKALGMQRRAFVSPMRLADGRFGYPLSPTPTPSPSPSPSPLVHDLGHLDAINRHLRQLEARGLQPAISNWVLSILAEMPITHEEITNRIAQLPVATAIELENSLNEWRTAPSEIANAQTRGYSRDMIEQALWRHWVGNAIPDHDEWGQTLLLGRTFLAEFPRQLPASFTSTVTGLYLHDVWLDHTLMRNLEVAQVEPQLNNLLQHFPHLQSLTIERPYAWNSPPSGFQHSFRLINERLPNLRELRVVNQNLALSAEAIGQLANPVNLRYLDLSGNTLNAQLQGQFGTPHLQYLGLERMAMSEWPTWLHTAALNNIEWLSLRQNDLAHVPDFLRYNEASANQPTVVTLELNPLGEDLIRNLAFSEDGAPRRFHFNLTLTPAIESSLQLIVNQRTELRQLLDQWVNSTLLEDEPVGGRANLARDLSGFWEARVRDLGSAPLHLMDVSLEHFPPALPDFFNQQVNYLILEQFNASLPQLEAFIRRLPRISTLALYENTQSIQSPPRALAELPELNELELVNQGLVIDDDALAFLVQLPALESLDLSDNQLSPALHGPFQVARRLAHLSLSSTGMAVWPGWLFDVMPTQTLDLDDNRLSRLPDTILEVPVIDNDSTRISLSGNPLDQDIRQRIDTEGGQMKIDLPHGHRPRQP